MIHKGAYFFIISLLLTAGVKNCHTGLLKKPTTKTTRTVDELTHKDNCSVYEKLFLK